MSVIIYDRFFTNFKSYKEYDYWNKQISSKNVIFNARYKDVYCPNHATSLSVKCAFGGNEFYAAKKLRYRVDNNCYLILNNGTQYVSYINSNNYVNSFSIWFDKNLVSDVINNTENSEKLLLDYPEIQLGKDFIFFETLYPYTPDISQQLNKIYEYTKDKCTDLNLLNEYIYILCYSLITAQASVHKSINNIGSKKKSTKIELYKRLNNAKDYIHSCYHEKINLADISKIAAISQFHLLRKFKSVFGLTPHQYLTKLRMEAAALQILETEDNISEISLNSGFESLSSFGEVFKKKYNYSPNNFRKKYKKAIIK